MRKMITVALATSLGVSAATVTAAPAHAEDGTYAVQGTVVYDGAPLKIRRKETRAQVRWSKQSDGSGVRVEFLDVDLLDGESWLNGYTKVKARFWNPDTGTTYREWWWGYESNDFTKNHDSVPGVDAGAMDYSLHMCGGSNHLWWRFRLRANGDGDLISKGHEEDAYCDGGGGGD